MSKLGAPDDSVTLAAEIQAAVAQLSTQQFDQLIQFLIEKLDPSADAAFLPLSTSYEHDIQVEVPHPFVSFNYGVGVRHITPVEEVSVQEVRAICTSFHERELESGVITLLRT